MSAIPRGAESAANSQRWYLEVSGRRAGPFAWTVLVELAEAGALHPDDRVWCMGRASWSRADGMPDLAPLIREPAPSTRALASLTSHAPVGDPRGPRVHPLLPPAALCVLLLLATVIGTVFYDRPSGRSSDGMSGGGFNPSSGSLAAFTRQASAFEARYPFLTELRRLDRPRFEQLDRAIRLGLRRGVPAGELNGYVAGVAGEIERQRLAGVDDSDALRFAMALRAAARTFRSSDPDQCAAILEPLSAVSAVRSAGALAAIAPALSALLDAPMTRRAVKLVSRKPPGRDADTADASPRMDCDRLLLMYDGAAAQTPDIGAAFIRAMQGTGGAES